MAIPATTDPALRIDEGGTVRVGRTRVTLRSVVLAFEEGASAEEIVLRYPSLDLADTYAAITHYLRHKSEVDAMLRDEDHAIQELHLEIERDFPTGDLRRRLRERMSAARTDAPGTER